MQYQKRLFLVTLAACLHTFLLGCPTTGPLLKISTSALDFGAASTALTFTVRNAGAAGTSLTFNVSAADTWISVDPPAGTLNAADPDTLITVTLDRDAMPQADSQSTVRVTSNGGAADITVHAGYLPKPILALSTNTVAFDRESGEKSIQVWNANTEGSVLHFTVAEDLPWITLYNATGQSTGTDNPATVTVAIERLYLEKAAYEGTLTISSDGGNASVLVTAEPEVYSGLAQKGFVVNADVYLGDTLLTSTSAQPSTLGQFEIPRHQLARFDIVTVVGTPSSQDTLDSVLDASDPSFEDRFLEVIVDPNKTYALAANPINTLVAAKYRANVAVGAEAGSYATYAASVTDVLSAFKVSDIQANWDMTLAGSEYPRLRHERIWALCELSIAAGNDLATSVDAMAGSLDGSHASALNRNLIDALINGTPQGAALASLRNSMAATLDHLFPDLPSDAPVTQASIVAAQQRLRTELDSLRGAGQLLDETTGPGLLAKLDAGTPTADAGDDQPFAKVGIPVTLDGRTSGDPQSLPLDYYWERNTFSEPLLSDDQSATPTFTSESPGVFTYHLWVYNANEWSARDTVVVTVSVNEAPVADAGEDFNARLNEIVLVSASASYDPNGDPLQFSWRILASPQGSSPLLIDGNGMAGRFTGDVEGSYELELTVSDGLGGVATDTVVVSLDLDGDGVLSPEDSDRDGDGVSNEEDLFPDDLAEYADSDGNDVGNYAQADEDDDGTPDTDDFFPFDAARAALPEAGEAPDNDTMESAGEIALQPPFALAGSLDTLDDQDHFAITPDVERIVTVVVLADGGDAEAELLSASGEPVDSLPCFIDSGVGIRRANAYLLGEGIRSVLRVQAAPQSPAIGTDYTVLVLNDADRDGVEDDVELALGMQAQSADPDGDGIFDAAESARYLRSAKGPLYSVDRDSDGVPNWFDVDSDGDEILDRLEGVSDPDRDGLPNFVSLDSDGNGLPDAAEAGDDPTWPLNSDADEAMDFADLDDDGDGLLDVNDLERLNPVPLADALSTERLLIFSAASTWDGYTLRNAAYAGDTIQLYGEGFVCNDAVIVFKGAESLHNVPPTVVSTTELTVEVPEGAGAALWVVCGGQRSNTLDLAILGEGQPALYEPASILGSFVVPGETLTLYGQNFDADNALQVKFEGVTAAPVQVAATEIQVVVPVQARTGEVVVSNGYGPSNAIFVESGRPVIGTITLPNGSVAPRDLVAAPGGASEVLVSASGQFQATLDNWGPVVVDVLYETPPDNLSLLLQALVLPVDTSVVADSQSTALALVFTGIAAAQRIDAAEWSSARATLAALPEVQALGTIIARGLADDPRFFDVPTQAFLDQSLLAYAAAQAALQDAGFTKRIGTASHTTENAMESKVLTPAIFPEELYGIALEQNGSQGNLSLLNDTQLFVSAEFRVPGRRSRDPLVPHVKSYFDQNMVGPQGWGLLFVSNEHAYAQPRGRNCSVFVATPGVQQPAADPEIMQALRLRTAVDQFLLPILSQALGPAIKGKDLAEAVLEVAPGALNDFGTKLSAHDPAGAFKSLGYNLLANKGNATKLFNAIGRKLGMGVGQDFAERIAKKLSAKLVPVVGQISAALEALETANLVGNLSGLIFDLGATPGEFIFNVEFPLGIDSIDPPYIVLTEHEQPLTITGKGFTPAPAGWFSAEKRPRVLLGAYYFNPELNQYREAWRETSLLRINATGTEMTVLAGASLCKALYNGLVGVRIEHDGSTYEWDQKLETNYVEIAALSPNHGSMGTPIVVKGLGFEPEDLLSVRFGTLIEGEEYLYGSTAARRLSATELLIAPPRGVESSWVTVVKRHTVGDYTRFTSSKQRVPFFVDRWTPSIGVSLSLNDQYPGGAVALLVDGSERARLEGYVNPSEWQDWPYIDHALLFPPLEAGNHTFTLRRIPASPVPARYSVSFGSGQPISFSGPPLNGSLSESQFTWDFVVGDKPETGHPER